MSVGAWERAAALLTDLKACDCKIKVCALHVEIFAHARDIGVAEVGLVEPFREEGQASVSKDEEVNFEKQPERRMIRVSLGPIRLYILLFTGWRPFRVPDEERWTVLAVRGCEDELDIV